MDFTNLVKESKEDNALNDGTYLGYIVKAELKLSKAGNEMIVFTIQLDKPKMKVWKYFVIGGESKMSNKFNFNTLINLFYHIGINKTQFLDNVENYLTNINDYFNGKNVEYYVQGDYSQITIK